MAIARGRHSLSIREPSVVTVAAPTRGKIGPNSTNFKGKASTDHAEMWVSDSDEEDRLIDFSRHLIPPVVDMRADRVCFLNDPCLETGSTLNSIFDSLQFECDHQYLALHSIKQNELYMRRAIMDLILGTTHSSRRALIYKEGKDRYKCLYKEATSNEKTVGKLKADLEAQIEISRVLKADLQRANENIIQFENETSAQGCLASDLRHKAEKLEVEKKTLEQRIEVITEQVGEVARELTLCKKKLEESKRASAELRERLDEVERHAAAKTHTDVIRGVTRFMQSSVFAVVCLSHLLSFKRHLTEPSINLTTWAPCARM